MMNSLSGRYDKECSNYHILALISHASKVMVWILQAKASIVHEQRNSRCSSWILKRQRNERSNCQHLLDHGKAREFQKNIYFCFIDYAKAFDCVDHNQLWKILQEMGSQTTLPASWEICIQVRKQQLELDMENRLVTHQERSTSKLCIVTLLV